MFQELLRLWRELEDRTISALEVLKTAATFNYQSKFDHAEQVWSELRLSAWATCTNFLAPIFCLGC